MRDSEAVVTPFMQVATYATRNFATLGLLELQPPFTGCSTECYMAHSVLHYQHRAGVRPYTSHSRFAESCVFSKQSLLPIHCARSAVEEDTIYSRLGPFLPKVQGEFAEFLTYGYLKRLGNLYHSTCVGLGNGADRYTVFLDQRVRCTRVHR